MTTHLTPSCIQTARTVHLIVLHKDKLLLMGASVGYIYPKIDSYGYGLVCHAAQQALLVLNFEATLLWSIHVIVYNHNDVIMIIICLKDTPIFTKCECTFDGIINIR